MIILMNACSNSERTPAQIASEQTLRDPSSVQYIIKAYNRSNDAICFKYRAKNGFGGMSIGYLVVMNEKAQDSGSAFEKNCKGDLENYTF